MQNYVKGGRDRENVTWPTFEILGPLHIAGSAEARKFGTP